MLKYDTFGALLAGEGLADGAWFHVFPGRDKLLYYQQKWVSGGTAAMADETRYQTKRNFTGAKRVFVLLPLEAREHYVFVGGYVVTSDARPEVDNPYGKGRYYLVENQFDPALFPGSLGRLVVEWRRPLRARYVTTQAAGADLALVGLRERPFDGRDVAFPGFQSFHLTFAELRAHARAPLVAWRSALSGVAGVYAITDAAHGVTYVGSACGTGGIWSRWMGYAATEHNGNARLRAHVEAHGSDGLVFSVLLVNGHTEGTTLRPRSRDPLRRGRTSSATI